MQKQDGQPKIEIKFETYIIAYVDTYKDDTAPINNHITWNY